MKPSDSLFLLIKSLSKPEKRHFKLDMAKYEVSGNKDYLRLFDAIETQKVYDEKAIRKKFDGEPYFRQLSRVKIYLNKQILKSLQNFYNEASSNMRLNNYQSHIEILFRKELYAECYEIIKKARNYAIKYEKLNYLLNIIDWEMIVAAYTSDMEQVDELKKNRTREQQVVLVQCQEIAELRKMYLESKYNVQTQGKARNRREMKAMDEIMKHPLMKNELRISRAEQLRIVLKADYAQWQGNSDEMYVWTKKAVQMYESKPHLLEEHLNAYFQNLLELTTISIGIDKHNEAIQLLGKLKTICEKHPDEINFKYKLAVYETEIDLYKSRGEFDEAARLIPSMVKFVGNNLQILDPLEELLYHNCIFGAYFGNGEYKKADFSLQKIIHSPHQDIRSSFRNEARIMNLILQFEQQEYLHLGYVLRSTYRYLLKNKSMYKSEAVIIDFLHKAIGVSSQKELLGNLSKMKTKLLELSNETFERNFMAGFPLIDWIDSKLENKSLAEICRSKYITNSASPGTN